MTGRYSIDSSSANEALAKAHTNMSVRDTLLTWCAVHGSLQMALRHPEFPATTRLLLEPFIEQLGAGLVKAGFFTAATLQESLDLERTFHAKRIGQD